MLSFFRLKNISLLLISLILITVISIGCAGKGTPVATPAPTVTTAPGITATPARVITATPEVKTPTATATVEIKVTPTSSPTATRTSTPTVPPPTPSPTPAIVDDLGKEIKLKAIPQRIISLAPSTTEILFSLGLGDKIVGVTDFCDYPEEVKTKTKVGSAFPGFNMEKIISLAPDIIFSVKAEQLIPQLESKGLTVVVLQPASIDGVYRDILIAGDLTGMSRKADEVVSGMQKRFETVKKKVEGVQGKTVFYAADVSDPAKIWTAGKGTFIDALIDICAGKNIASIVNDWTTFSMETLLKSDPQVIILGGANWGVNVKEVSQRTGWKDLSAVKSGKIYCITDDPFVRPGPRLAEGAEIMLGLIYPELSK